MTPLAQSRLFLAELRAGRASALKLLRYALRTHDRSLSSAARHLGVSRNALYEAARANPRVQLTLQSAGMRRAEAVRRARAAKTERASGEKR